MEESVAPRASAVPQGVTEWSGPPMDAYEPAPYPGYGVPCTSCDACEGFCGECDGCERGYYRFDRPGQLWFRGDFLLWWTKGADLPPLVTTSPAGTAEDVAGVLGEDDTAILFGGSGVSPGSRPGGRFTLGYSFYQCPDSGIEATYLFLSGKSAGFHQTSTNGNPILARPLFDVDTSLQDAVLIAFPDVAVSSQLDVDLHSEFQSFELLSRQTILRTAGDQVDFLFGYRYGRFAERLGIDQNFTAGPDHVLLAEGTVVQASDLFDATNDFHGVEFGIAARRHYARWSLEGLGKIALGGTRSRVSIAGNTISTVPGESPVESPGAMLALPTNIGRYVQSGFTAIPELGLNVGYDLTPRLKATFGYTLLYWSRIARPGDQIDVTKSTTSTVVNVNVNPTQMGGGDLTGVPAPGYRFVTTDFWAQGLSFGLDYRF